MLIQQIELELDGNESASFIFLSVENKVKRICTFTMTSKLSINLSE